jgi:hypothetical protein
VQDDRASGWTTNMVRYWHVVDLTAEFGAGNEPTQTEYENWLKKQPNYWYDTTAKIHGWLGARTNIVKATANDSLSSQFGAQQATTFRTTKLVEGETYTLSFLVRGNVSAINHAYIRNTGTSDASISMNEAVASATVFNRVSKTFVATADMGNSTASWLYIGYNGAFTTSSWFEIQEVKLEKGNVVTDWCPAATETSAFNSTTNMWYRIDNERAGYYNATTDEFVGGLAVVGSEVASIAQILTDRENPLFYASIGTRTDVAWGNWNGIYGYSYWSDPLGPYDVGFHETMRLESVLSGTATLWSLYNPQYNDIGIYHETWDMVLRHGYSQAGATAATAYVRSTSSSTDAYSEICATPDDVKHIWLTSDATATTTILPQIQTGTVASVGTAGWSSVSFPVAFPTGTTVKVLATPVTETAGVIAEKIRSESVTGFDIIIGGSGISGISVNWVAFAV